MNTSQSVKSQTNDVFWSFWWFKMTKSEEKINFDEIQEYLFWGIFDVQSDWRSFEVGHRDSSTAENDPRVLIRVLRTENYYELIKNTHTPGWLNELSSLMLFQLYGASTRVHKMPDPRYFVSHRLVNTKLRNVGYQKLFVREKYLYLK